MCRWSVFKTNPQSHKRTVQRTLDRAAAQKHSGGLDYRSYQMWKKLRDMASSNPMVLAPKHLCEESETAIRIENNSLFLGTIKCSCLETALVSAHECHKRLRCFL